MRYVKKIIILVKFVSECTVHGLGNGNVHGVYLAMHYARGDGVLCLTHPA